MPCFCQCYLGGAGVGGSRTCVWSSGFSVTPGLTCLHITVSETQGSSRISAMSARFLGSMVSIRPMMCLDSRGSRRRSRHGPRITSLRSGSPESTRGVPGFGLFGGSPATGSGAGVSVTSFFSLGGTINCFGSWPGVGCDANSL